MRGGTHQSIPNILHDLFAPDPSARPKDPQSHPTSPSVIPRAGPSPDNYVRHHRRAPAGVRPTSARGSQGRSLADEC